MQLVVGLGNPGSSYRKNRHNIGFMAVEAIAEKYSASPWTKKFGGLLCDSQLATCNSRLFFLKPQTYMNLSGESVAAAAHFYKIPPEQTVVFHDDLDLAPGKLKVKQGGGNGGHNGIKSIDAHIGDNYWRVRIGIGHPGHKDDVSPYVLSNFSKEEWEVQEKMIEAIASHFTLLAANDAAGFMNKVALSTKSPVPST